MKNKFKIIGIIALAVVIGFVLVSCNTEEDDWIDVPDGDGQ